MTDGEWVSNLPVVLEQETHVTGLALAALLPYSRLAQTEDTVVQHVHDRDDTNSIGCTPYTAQPAPATSNQDCFSSDHALQPILHQYTCNEAQETVNMLLKQES